MPELNRSELNGLYAMRNLMRRFEVFAKEHPEMDSETQFRTYFKDFSERRILENVAKFLTFDPEPVNQK